MRLFKMSWLFLAPAAAISVSHAATSATEHASETLPAKSRQVPRGHSSAALPTGTYHVVLRTDGTEPTDVPRITLYLLVSPSRRHLVGVFQMAQPMKFQAALNGQYTQASSPAFDEATLAGYPRIGSPCMPSRIAVVSNLKIELRVRPDWREGVATISYPQDPRALARHEGEWRTALDIKLTGGRPIGWRDVSDFTVTSGQPIAWDGRCFESDKPADRKLRRLGTDASSRQLSLRSEPEGSLRQWYLRNDSGKHILARYTCFTTAPGRRYSDTTTTLVHPYEDLTLEGFPDVQQRICRVEQSHYD